MNILVLEDRPRVSYDLREVLQDYGHNLLVAYTVGEAQEHWETGKVDIILADLNMASVGLSDSEMLETRGGVLTGWIWLSHYVFAERPEMRCRTVIYSAYPEDLRRHVPPYERQGVRIVEKLSGVNTLQAVVDAIEAISVIG